MSLEDDIRETLVVDANSVLQANLERVEPLLDIFDDGTIVISPEYQHSSIPDRMLIFFIAQRYASEVDMVESDTISYQFFYERFDADNASIRKGAEVLRNAGLINQVEEGSHRVVPENIPLALERLESD